MGAKFHLKEFVGVVGAGLPLRRVDEMRRQNVVQVGVVAAHSQPGGGRAAYSSVPSASRYTFARTSVSLQDSLLHIQHDLSFHGFQQRFYT